MCGRYALAGDWHDFTTEFELEEVPGLSARYNIAPSAGPGYEAPIVTAQGLVFARFWYIPRWWKQPLKKLPTTFNVRSETATDKPLFRGAERCLVPTSGWREFPGSPGKKKAFHLYLPRDHEAEPEAHESGGTEDSRFFAFAGLWTTWTEPDTGEVVPSFAIVTGEPSPLVKRVHHRMPLLVPREDYAAFLEADQDFKDLAARALRFSHEAPLRMVEASTYGNSTLVEGPECIAPLSASSAAPGQQSLF